MKKAAEVPSDLQKALAGNGKAKVIFDGLPPSHQRAYIDWITEARKDETRARRVAKAVAMLEAGEKRM